MIIVVYKDIFSCLTTNPNPNCNSVWCSIMQHCLVTPVFIPQVLNYLQATSDLSWTLSTITIVKKAPQRLYFISLVRKASLNHCPLTQDYRGLIESIHTAGITVWYSNITPPEGKALQKTAESIKGTKLPCMISMHTECCWKRAEGIIMVSFHTAHMFWST